MRATTVPRLWFFLILGLFVCSVGFNIYYLREQRNHFRVVQVFDGDSFLLADGRRIRLLSVDAPERGRCMADEARNQLTALLLGRVVRIKDLVIDSYGRTLANVIVEPTLFEWGTYVFGRFQSLFSHTSYAPMGYINGVMIREGLAQNIHVGTNYNTVLDDYGETAKSMQLGIYSSACRQMTAPTSCTIKGNIRAGVRQYYLPICKYYVQTIVDLSYGDQWFCTEVEAIQAGFEKAERCE